LIVLLAALFPSRAAAADPPLLSLDLDPRAVAAEALFDQGRRLSGAGRYAEACARFIDSERLDHGVGTLLNLADCYEKNGQTASARAGFRAVVAAAIAEQQPDRERIAWDREIALLPTLARLTITPPRSGLPPGSEVHRDGILLHRALWGAPVPVDPGDHVIVVSAPGKVDYATTVHVPRQAAITITARIPALRSRPAPPPVAPAPVLAPPPSRHPRATAGLVLMGLSGAGVAVGTIFGVRALGLKGDAGPHCKNDSCDEVGTSLRADAGVAGTASSIAFAASAATLAAGLVLYVTAPPRSGITVSAGLSGRTVRFAVGATW
jgi:serine/threonine-protein kinase